MHSWVVKIGENRVKKGKKAKNRVKMSEKEEK
jgi:hypothetical protein